MIRHLLEVVLVLASVGAGYTLTDRLIARSSK